MIIVLDAAFTFWQKHRADRSAERLRDLLPSTARVVRDDAITLVDPAELVVVDAVAKAVRTAPGIRRVPARASGTRRP